MRCAFDLAVAVGIVAVFYYNYEFVVQKVGYFSPYWVVFLVAYYFYYREYAFYFFRQPSGFTQGRRMMGKTLPAFPNGWFLISTSEELKKGDVKYINQNGVHVALFRGEDGVAYAVDAYCPHIGANLGVAGKVVHKNCIQCPFHGWEFDGETGKLISGREKKPVQSSVYAYYPEIGVKQTTADTRLAKSGDEQTTLGTWKLKEQCGFIFLWIHALKREPEYEPFDITEYTEKLKYRGTSVNQISSHIQDIVENGGDVRHFMFVHSILLPFTNAIGASWRAKWRPGDDPNLYKEMEHEVPYVHEFKRKLLDRYLTEKNKKHIGVISLDCYLSVGCVKKSFFFNATAFQVGPGLVYLFLISPYYKAVFFQHAKSEGKFQHELVHELYASWYLPYCITASFLRLEAQQVMNDGIIWDNKKFGLEPRLRQDLESDKTILIWRRWFAQFYEGCKEKEAAEEKLVW